MKRINVRLAVLMAAIMMTMMSFAKTQDFGGRVLDEKGEPMPYVNVVLLSLPDSAFVQPDEGGHATAQRSCSKRSAAQDTCQR